MRRAFAVLMGAAVGSASATFPVRDTDLFWHLATAREALAHGIVRSDLFSWTVAGAPVPTDQWLGQLVLYAGYALGSWQGVLIVRTLAVTALVALIAGAALARVGRVAGSRYSVTIALAIATPAVVLSRALWTERPEIFGAVLFAALILLLQLPGRAPLFAIAPLLVVWANVHGSFALGSGLVLLVSAYGAWRDRELRAGYAVAAAGALASFVLTPALFATAAVPALHVLGQPRQIVEEMVPDPRTPAGIVWALTLGALVATAALSRPARWRDVAVIVPTALLSLVALRFTPFIAIAATPYLVERLPAALAEAARLAADGGRREPGSRTRGSGEQREAQGEQQRSGLARATERPRPPSAGRTRRREPRAVLGAAAVAMLVTAIAFAPRDLDDSAYPVAALAALPAGPGLLNEYDWGGWLIWTAPDTPVFIDGRLKPYRTDVLRDYVTVVEAHPGWRDVVARRGIRWLLVRPAQPIAVRALDLGWPVLARSDRYVLLEVRP